MGRERVKLSERSLLEAMLRRKAAPVGVLAADVAIPESTAGAVLGRLVDKGRVHRRENGTGRRGRPSYLYGLNLAKPVVALHWDGSQLAGTLFAPNFAPLASEILSVGIVRTIGAAVSLAEDLVVSLAARSDLARNKVRRLALWVNAISTPDGNLRSSVLPWIDSRVVSVFEKRLELSTHLVSHPGLLTEYHLLTENAPASVAYLHAGDGVSSRFTAFGREYCGQDQWAGQLGHITVDPGGPRCGCGRRGCLEAYCSGAAISLAANQMAQSRVAPPWLKSAVKRQSVRLLVEDIWHFWQSGDRAARALMEEPLEKLAWGLGMAINLLDPSLVIAGGYLLQGRAAWIEELERRCRSWALYGGKRKLNIRSGQADIADLLRTTALLSEGQPWRSPARRS